MKRKRNYITLISLLFLLSAKSQQLTKVSPAIKFQSNLQSGILIGQKGSEPAFVINAVNGVQAATWFAGIGVGIDYYEKRTIPLFINVEKNLSAKAKAFFLYGSAGYNFAWLKDNEKIQYVEKYDAGGLFYEAGAGYKFTIFSKMHIGFSAGYCYKQLKEKYITSILIEWLPNTPPPDNNYEYRRIAIKFNWWLK